MSRLDLRNCEEKKMVYCTRCGTKNPDESISCSNCGAPLPSVKSEMPYYRHDHHFHDSYYYYRRRGGGFRLIIFNLIIIVIGLLLLAGMFAYFWPIILVLIGLWLITRAVMRNRRYRTYRQPPSS